MRKLFIIFLCVGFLVVAGNGFAKKKPKTKQSHTQSYQKCYRTCNDIQKEAIQMCVDNKEKPMSKCIQQAAKDKQECMDLCRNQE